MRPLVIIPTYNERANLPPLVEQLLTIPDLRTAMLAIKYTFNVRDEIQLVAKEDILEDNPDLDLDTLDALFLTFGGPLAVNAYAGGDHPHKPPVEFEYDPYAPERMLA